MKNPFHFFKPKTAEDRLNEQERLEKARSTLLAELSQHRTDGTPVSHRRLESLMLVAGTGKRETVRLLRAIGARPSTRSGGGMWTLRPKA